MVDLIGFVGINIPWNKTIVLGQLENTFLKIDRLVTVFIIAEYYDSIYHHF